jgi:hypothetical protein
MKVMPHLLNELILQKMLSTLGHPYLLSFSMATSTSKELGSNANHSPYLSAYKNSLPIYSIVDVNNSSTYSKFCVDLHTDHHSHPLTIKVLGWYPSLRLFMPQHNFLLFLLLMACISQLL